MRVALIYEKKTDFPFAPTDPEWINSELLSESEENELISGLCDAGHEVLRVGDGEQLVKWAERWRSRCDLALNLSVGYRGLDRKSFVPGVLELAKIPYVGSRPHAQSLARHKFHAKLIVSAAGVATPPAVLWHGDEDDDKLEALPYPAIVKPVAESSSVGIRADRSFVSTASAASATARWIVDTFAQPAIVEHFIHGTEVEVPLLGWPKLEALGVAGVALDGAPIRGATYLTSEIVYGDRYEYLVPAPGVEPGAIEAAAVRVGRALCMRDYGRVDFRVAEDGTPYFMDAAATPHIMRHSSFFALARAQGKSYPQMLDEVLEVAIARHRATSAGSQSSQNSMSQRYQEIS